MNYNFLFVLSLTKNPYSIKYFINKVKTATPTKIATVPPVEIEEDFEASAVAEHNKRVIGVSNNILFVFFIPLDKPPFKTILSLFLYIYFTSLINIISILPCF